MVICTTLQPEHWTTNHQTQESNNSKRQSIVSLPTYVHPVSQSVSQGFGPDWTRSEDEGKEKGTHSWGMKYFCITQRSSKKFSNSSVTSRTFLWDTQSQLQENIPCLRFLTGLALRVSLIRRGKQEGRAEVSRTETTSFVVLLLWGGPEQSRQQDCTTSEPGQLFWIQSVTELNTSSSRSSCRWKMCVSTRQPDALIAC